MGSDDSAITRIRMVARWWILALFASAESVLRRNDVMHLGKFRADVEALCERERSGSPRRKPERSVRGTPSADGWQWFRADVAQLVEHSLGKGEVTSSILVIGSR